MRKLALVAFASAIGFLSSFAVAEDIGDVPIGANVLPQASCYTLQGCTYSEVTDAGTLIFECVEGNCTLVDFIPANTTWEPPGNIS